MDTASKLCRVDRVRKWVIADVCRIVDQDSGKSARHRLASSADAVCGIFDLIGLAAATGTILLTPNEQRVAEDRRDCYWLYIVTNCATKPTLQEPVKDPAPARMA